MTRRGCSSQGPGTSSVRRRQAQASEAAPIDRDVHLRSLARSLTDDFRGLDSALDAERLASMVTSFWGDEELHRRNHFEPRYELALVAQFEELGDSAALGLLSGLALVAGGRVGPAAGEAAARLLAAGVVAPAWLDRLGTATPTAAWVLRDPVFQDGELLVTDFEMAGERPHLLAAWVDHNLGGMVKHIHLCGSIEESGILALRDPATPFEKKQITIEEMGARLRAALDETPSMLRMQRGIEGSDLYALAHSRALAMGGDFEVSQAPELSPDERFELLEDFLTSPEGAGFRSDYDAQTVVAHAIDFCADYVDGRPLRWSPVVVRLFLLEWLPEEVGDHRAPLDRAAAALSAWIAYAGRRRDVPGHKIAETVAAIEPCLEDMYAAAEAYGGAGSAA
jgi:hypothetical protein